MHLSGEEHCQVPKTAESETAMPTGEASPSILQRVMILFRTDGNGDKLVDWGVGGWFAACNEIGPWPAHRIFRNIGEKGGQYEANKESQNRDMSLVPAGSRHNHPEKKYNERHYAGIYDVPQSWHSLHDGVREMNSDIVEREHAMKRFNEQEDLIQFRAPSK